MDDGKDELKSRKGKKAEDLRFNDSNPRLSSSKNVRTSFEIAALK